MRQKHWKLAIHMDKQVFWYWSWLVYSTFCMNISQCTMKRKLDINKCLDKKKRRGSIRLKVHKQGWWPGVYIHYYIGNVCSKTYVIDSLVKLANKLWLDKPEPQREDYSTDQCIYCQQRIYRALKNKCLITYH